MDDGFVLNDAEIAAVRASYREKGKRVVLCHGVFDLLHLGHLRHLKAARREGDILVVSITADAFVRKGPDRPVFSEQLRAEMLAGLSVVDHVIISRSISAIDVIERLQPDVYVKGNEYQSEDGDVTQNISKERTAVEAHGGRVVFTDDLTFSSSNLLNLNFDVFPPITRQYLIDLKKRFSSTEILDQMRRLKGMRVAVVGDAIIDRYTYCKALGKSGKGSFITVKHGYTVEYAGGAIAVANHVAGFVDQVTLVTGIGDPARGNNFEDFIREKLSPNVTPQFCYLEDSPTLVKERFVESDMNKLFEVYFFEDELMRRYWDDQAATQWLDRHLGEFDAVIVPDYGNGFITDGMVRVLCRRAPFLAVNTQLNGGNHGYHAITRYDCADFIAINEPELRLGCHDSRAPLESLAVDIARRLKTKCLTVTLGVNGAMTVTPDGAETIKVPALASKIVDRVGAGDAFLSLAAPCLAAGVDREIATFLGSVSAALDVQIVGTSEPVDPISLAKYVISLMK